VTVTVAISNNEHYLLMVGPQSEEKGDVEQYETCPCDAPERDGATLATDVVDQ